MLSMLFSLALAASPSDALYQQLSLRDGVSCSSLGTVNATLRDQLLELSAPTMMPPSVPVRAADCLVSLFAADPVVQATFVAWAGDIGHAGQTLLVVGRLAELPSETQVAVAKAALSVGDAVWQARFSQRLVTLNLPSLQTILVVEKK